jgi:hypothetical protein
MAATVKTTIELPADLLREVKLRAVHENRRMKDVVAEAIRRGLDAPPRTEITHRVQFPLVHSTHPAPPGQELTPDRTAQILIDQDAEWALQAGRDPA